MEVLQFWLIIYVLLLNLAHLQWSVLIYIYIYIYINNMHDYTMIIISIQFTSTEFKYLIFLFNILDRI